MIEALQARVAQLGCAWDGVTAAQMGCGHDIRPRFDSILAPAGLSALGIAWYPAWPPVG